MMQIAKASKLEEFLLKYNIVPVNVQRLKSDLSFREYYRIHCAAGDDAPKTYILMDSCADRDALVKTLRVTRAFRRLGIAVPEVFCYDLDFGYALVEDFGPNILNSIMNNMNEELYYKQLLDVIAGMQLKTLNNNSVELSEYTCELLDLEIMQFCDHYLHYNLPESASKRAIVELCEIFHGLYNKVNICGKALVHRDFHVDNLLLKPNNTIGIIDHQDAVLGSCVYDVVSLMQDARRQVSAQIERQMLQYFLNETGYNSKDFMTEYSILAIQKNFKIIGIFNRNARQKGKQDYLKKCDIVWGYIRRTLSGHSKDLLPITHWFEKYNLKMQNEQNHR